MTTGPDGSPGLAQLCNRRPAGLSGGAASSQLVNPTSTFSRPAGRIVMERGASSDGGVTVGLDGRQRFRHLRISGGRVACTSCQQWTFEVVLLEADRPLCVDCASQQLDADLETVRAWLRAQRRPVRGRAV